MTQISTQTFIADSNGGLSNLASDFYQNPATQAVDVFDKAPKYCRGKWFACSPESTGELYVQFETSGGIIKSTPVLLTPGAVINIAADVVRPIAVRRSGIITLMFGEGIAPLYFQQNTNRPRSCGFSTVITPSSAVPLTPAGGGTDIYCHPLALPNVALTSTLFVGASLNVDYATGERPSSVLASDWFELSACVFHVDPITKNVVDIRRIYNYLYGITIPANINAWDRIGLLAIPSDTNAIPGVPPTGPFTLRGDGHAYHNRNKNSFLIGQTPGLL